MTSSSKILALAACAALAAGAGCGKKDEAAVTTPTASQALGKVSNGMKSSASKGNLNATSRVAASARAAAAANESCTTSGTPAATYTQTTVPWSGAQAYCSLTADVDGPDTAKGAIDRIKGFVCAAENAGMTFDNTAHVLTVKIDTTCFSQTFSDMVATQLGKSSIDVTVTAYSTIPADKANAAYDKFVIIDTGTAVGSQIKYNMAYKVTSTSFQGAIWDEADTRGMAIAASMDWSDTAATVMRTEGRFGGSGNPEVRHMRAYVKGPYDGSYFTDVKHLEYIHGETYANGSGWYNTMKGNPTDGYKLNYYGASSAPYTIGSFGAAVTGCRGDGSCTGNTGITISAAADMAFTSSVNSGKADYVSFKDWYLRAPLAFDAVTTAAVQ